MGDVLGVGFVAYFSVLLLFGEFLIECSQIEKGRDCKGVWKSMGFEVLTVGEM